MVVVVVVVVGGTEVDVVVDGAAIGGPVVPSCAVPDEHAPTTRASAKARRTYGNKGRLATVWRCYRRLVAIGNQGTDRVATGTPPTIPPSRPDWSTLDPELWVYIAIAAGLAGLLLAATFARLVLATSPGDERMQELMLVIRQGAMTFLRREYVAVAVFVAAMATLIFVLLDWGRPWGAIAYVTGAVLSASAGLIGMRIATAANARTTEGARRGGVAEALTIAFRGGAVTGFTVAGLALLGLAVPSGSSSRSSSSTTRSAFSPPSGSVPPASRSSPGWAAASTRRRPTSAPTWWGRSRREYPRTIPATRR